MEAFPHVASSARRDFRRPPPGGHFGCLGCVPPDAGPRVRGRCWRTGPRRRRRDRCLHLTEARVRLGRGTAGDEPNRGRDTNFQPAPGPAPPTGRDGGGHADGRGSDPGSGSSALGSVRTFLRSRTHGPFLTPAGPQQSGHGISEKEPGRPSQCCSPSVRVSAPRGPSAWSP